MCFSFIGLAMWLGRDSLYKYIHAEKRGRENWILAGMCGTWSVAEPSRNGRGEMSVRSNPQVK